MALVSQLEFALPIVTAAIAALATTLAAVLPVWLKLRHERITREADAAKAQNEQDALVSSSNVQENQLVSIRERLKELEVRVSQLQGELSASRRSVGAPQKEPARQSKAYALTGPRGADAKGEVVEGGFLVRQDSSVATEVVPSIPPSASKLRAQLLDEGVLAKHGERLTFTKDHCFPSPSSAAGVVLGRSANGLLEWKDADGRSLATEKGGAGKGTS